MIKLILIISTIILSFNIQASVQRAKQLVQNKQYGMASMMLYKDSKKGKSKFQKTLASYELAKTLNKMGLKQAATFELVKVVRRGKSGVLSNALELLSEISLDLGDSQSLNYAVSKMQLGTIPRNKRSLLYYRLGQVFYASNDYENAVQSLSKVTSQSDFFGKAQYYKGLAYSEMNKTKQALRSFTTSTNFRRKDGYTDVQRVSSLLGIARALYQMKKWDKAADAYRRIPRDSVQWHESLPELAWSLLQAGKFRSALSVFQTLHSDFYEDYYLPEPLILRGIIYLYICRYEEVKKVIDIYEKKYSIWLNQLSRYLKSRPSVRNDFKETVAALKMYKTNNIQAEKLQIPYAIHRALHRTSTFRAKNDYLRQLQKEQILIKSFSSAWQKSNVGKYVRKITNKRKSSAIKELVKYSRQYLKDTVSKLESFEDQKEFLRFEVLRSKKENYRKIVDGKSDQINSKDKRKRRDFYVKNGYEYWPFQGEYWLDELGNYHYVGKSSCK